ncbi:DUF2721 domain-containing protein [Nitrosomonas sp. Nm166]|uniref:DUF2721 domain-containing protein n=1 Tax=Nitrosomonas sp. Nm166 TaxID=1881054 RepID=UPI0008EC3642|nr:DUF2721 domain-containing protein [Nitrosomonas sp. Nm166]SFD97433.1 Protein of unknown function [Nitrosomonas sp. Nm166]
MEEISVSITVLTAMITPAVLILACGSLLLTTSQRLNRSIDRTRKISIEFKDMQGNKSVPEQEQQMLFRQMEKAAKRSILLQRAMALLYISLFFFIATSLLIGIFEILNWIRSWILISFSIIGILMLLCASFFLVMETRLALGAVHDEMKFRLTIDKKFNR